MKPWIAIYAFLLNYCTFPSGLLHYIPQHSAIQFKQLLDFIIMAGDKGLVDIAQEGLDGNNKNRRILRRLSTLIFSSLPKTNY